MIYLDSAATALQNKNSLQIAFEAYLNDGYNPSSAYKEAKNVANKIKMQKAAIAKILNCSYNQLYFTSSATESNNIVLSSFLHKKGGTILISPLEHASVFSPAMRLKQFGFNVKELPITREAQLDFEKIDACLTTDVVGLFAIFVCNENGAILNIKKLSSIIDKYNQNKKEKIHLHCDCVQALGKIPISLEELNIDSAAFSGHKIGAIKGSGLLYLKGPLTPIYDGGGQENGIRSGTENIGAISSFVYSLEEANANLEVNKQKALGLKSHLLNSIKEIDKENQVVILPVGDTKLILDEELFSPYIIQLAIPPLPSEVIVRIFDDNDIAISGGSACASNRRSKALRISMALKFPTNIASSTIRVSFGYSSTKKDIDQFILVLKEKILPLAKKF